LSVEPYALSVDLTLWLYLDRVRHVLHTGRGAHQLGDLVLLVRSADLALTVTTPLLTSNVMSRSRCTGSWPSIFFSQESI
jgi:hypothetical protein